MKNFIQHGNVIDCIAPSGGVVSGAAYKIGDLFGVAAHAASESAEFAMHVAGVFSLPKAGTITPGPGVKLYWDNAARNITTTSSGNTLVGVHAGKAAAGAADATLPVRLGIVA